MQFIPAINYREFLLKNLRELDSLEQINGFSNLETVNVGIQISEASQLSDISGLSKLNYIYQMLFRNLDSLISILPELEKVEHVPVLLQIESTGVCESEINIFHDGLITKPTTYINFDNENC